MKDDHYPAAKKARNIIFYYNKEIDPQLTSNKTYKCVQESN